MPRVSADSDTTHVDSNTDTPIRALHPADTHLIIQIRIDMPDDDIHTDHAFHSTFQQLLFRIGTNELDAAWSRLTPSDNKVRSGRVVEVL